MKYNAAKVNARDNVLVVITNLEARGTVTCNGIAYTLFVRQPALTNKVCIGLKCAGLMVFRASLRILLLGKRLTCRQA